MITRRGLLGGAAAAVLAGGAGVAAGLLWPIRHERLADPTPAWLASAIARETVLIHELEAAMTTAAARGRLGPLRDDHTAHLAALNALRAPDVIRAATTGPASGSSTAAPRPVAQLRASEQSAATASTAASAALTGSNAVLLASIAACEASHAELLT